MVDAISKLADVLGAGNSMGQVKGLGSGQVWIYKNLIS
jgi:hypothetical protein